MIGSTDLPAKLRLWTRGSRRYIAIKLIDPVSGVLSVIASLRKRSVEVLHCLSLPDPAKFRVLVLFGIDP
jgi:hypothetical protein